MTQPLFEQLFGLVGKRFDDPAVVAFHRDAGLPAPPVVIATSTLQAVAHPTDGYTLNHAAEVCLPGCYPPRRERGRFVSYVKSVDLDENFAGPIAAGFSVKTPAAEARDKAARSRSTPMLDLHVVHAAGGKHVELVYAKNGDFREVRLGLDELEADSPELTRLAAQVPKHAPRQVPASVGEAQTEPLPELVRALIAVQRSDGLGELDLEIYGDFQTGGPGAWTGNADAERELRVFGGDGSGGLLAFWLVHAGRPLSAQPIVFLESEGGSSAIASDLVDFVVVLAAGIGPYEIVAYGKTQGTPHPALSALAAQHRPGRQAVDAILEGIDGYGDITDRLIALRG